ncbi:hypothetical protein FACS1894166_12270 [Bacilli bacterium]|nr:hypothetical protein FACS1894166_12270 [Bacilli bacterium]
MQVEHNTLLPTHITDRKSNYQIPIAWIVDNGIEVTELHLSSFDKIDVHYNPKHSSEIITKNMHIGIMAFDKKLSNGNNSILQMYRNGIVNFPNQQINIHDSKLTWLNNS